MRVGVFGDGDIPYVHRLVDGAAALGWDAELRPVDENYRGFDFDLVVIGGGLLRYNALNGRIFNHYLCRDTQVLVVEMGRMLNPEIKPHTHWFFYMNQVPSLKYFCRGKKYDERRNRLFPKLDFRKRGHAVVVMGQNKSVDAMMNATVLPEIRGATNRPIIWRPRAEHSHPDNGFCDYSSHGRPLKKDLEKAWCVVTHSSNAGAEALAMGVPVICHETATYSSLGSGSIKDIEKCRRPKREDVENYFRSMAQITWSNEEMSSGEALQWFVDTGQILTEKKTLEPVENLESNIIALTCTGGRQETFTQLERYVERQSLRPTHWVIVDDVSPQTKISESDIEQAVIIPAGCWKPGDQTYARNFRLACEHILEHIGPGWVAIFEDDDWYHQDYLQYFIPRLQKRLQDGIYLAGEFNNVYYHVVFRHFKRVGPHAQNATMASTIFHTSAIPDILSSIDGYEGLSLDLKIFHSAQRSRMLLYDTDYVVGIKGVPQVGRDGGTHSHSAATVKRAGWKPDRDLSFLRSLIGDDVEFYAKFFDASFEMPDPPAPRRKTRRRRVPAAIAYAQEHKRRRRR